MASEVNSPEASRASTGTAIATPHNNDALANTRIRRWYPDDPRQLANYLEYAPSILVALWLRVHSVISGSPVTSTT
jgi:hypothetical protein